MNRVHENKPNRRNNSTPQTQYGKYRAELREDFNNSCGYCDDSDVAVDRIAFHIDHFAPKKQFPHLELNYSNLVYACRYCNIAKSNHWHGDDAAKPHDGEKGFIDPCSAEYEEHLGRDHTGKIVGLTDLGQYMVQRLKLNLLRHEILWQARKAMQMREEVEGLLEAIRSRNLPKGEKYIELLERFEALTKRFEEYQRIAYA